MKTRILAIALLITSSTAGGRTVLGEHASHIDMHAGHGGAVASAFALPTAADTRTLLEGAVHNSEFVDVTAGDTRLRAYVSYPDRAEKAPVLVVTTGEGMSDFARAMAFQASREGFIGIAHDNDPVYLAEADTRRRVREFASGIAAATGTIATVDVRDGRIAASIDGAHVATFALNDQGWSSALKRVAEETGNRFTPIPGMDHVAMEMRAEAEGQAAGGQAGRGAAQDQTGRGTAPGQPRQAPGLNTKPDDLPANWVMADRVANTTPRRNEWVDIAVPGTNAKVRTWVVYPEGTQKAGAVLVLHGASGMSDWIRSVADQLAKEGFIAIAVDLSSGLGPNGGHYDSFRFMDERMRATQTLGRDGTMARIKAVRDFAAKMPQSNGKTGSIGFCGGGTNSFTLATEVPEHNASVTYYGAAPPAAALAKINAPVLGFYGEDDARIFASVEPTRAEMKKLGKAYEGHTYPHATHSFLWMQDLGNNFEATADSWPRTIAFYRQHLATPGSR